MEGGLNDEDLERQAQAMAEKALEKLPESVRATKIDKVKEGILKRLKAQASGPAAAPVSGPVPGPGAPVAPAAPPPPSAPAPPPPPDEGAPTLKKVDGVEMCGDEPWFADHAFRASLRARVVAAHAEQKILVGPPADEIRRICPPDGRILGAGAVLRLGGATLGGYGESDIAYAYRQLSRALHPDKNPNIPEAPKAFHRLQEAADELRQGLNESRAILRAICAATGAPLVQEVLERPQEALLAEATRLLFAVLGLSGEGEVPDQAHARAPGALATSPAHRYCHAPQLLLVEWFDRNTLLDYYASASLRTAYDSAPKKLRAYFLCALNRCTMVEAKRNHECVRGNWQAVMETFAELGFWRDFRERIRGRVWAPDGDPEPPSDGPKRSKWDEKAAPKASTWATHWRAMIKAVLPRGVEAAVPATESELRLLSAALWRDIAAWSSEEAVGGRRYLEFFTAEPRPPAASAAEALLSSKQEEAAEWAFVPAADILLLVGEGAMGITGEGYLANGGPGHEQMTFEEALKTGGKGKEDNGKRRKKSRSRSRSRSRDGDKDKARKDRAKEQDPNFDWEKIWRTRMMEQKMRRGRDRGRSPLPMRYRSRSRDRVRRRSRSRSCSRERLRRRSRSVKRRRREIVLSD